MRDHPRGPTRIYLHGRMFAEQRNKRDLMTVSRHDQVPTHQETVEEVARPLKTKGD